MSALSTMRLVPKPGRVVGGSARLDGEDLLALPVTEMRKIWTFGPMTDGAVLGALGELLDLLVRARRQVSRQQEVGAWCRWLIVLLDSACATGDGNVDESPYWYVMCTTNGGGCCALA